MKILQIFGAVVAVHLLAFIFIFASPGCQSGPRNIPTPDATMPSGGTGAAPVAFNVANPQPVDLGTTPAGYNSSSPSGHASPTRPGSAAAVAITPAKPTANVASISTYTVMRGDSMWTIAKKHNLTVAELGKANNIGAGVALRPAQKLMIPLKAGATPPANTTNADGGRNLGTLAQQTRPANGETIKHLVQPGESLGVIARKYQVTVAEIAVANNLSGPTIVAGRSLIIPGAKGTAPKAPATASQPKATPPDEIPSVSTTPLPSNPRFEITPPPPGQDLDAGLNEPSTTAVPTIKVEETPPPKS